MSALPVELTLFHRFGCHLCEDMLEQLRELEREWGFSLRVVDVDADPGLCREYNERVPVLERDGREICRYFLDRTALKDCLGG